MPVVFNKNIDEDTILAVWKIEESEEQLRSGLQLKQHELDFISSLNNGKRLLHWLSTRVLLRTMLNTAEYIDCRMDDHGKPYLPDFNYHISLSHSYDYAAVIIGKTKKVGVDIELIKHKIRSIRHKFLSDVELAQKQIGDNINGLYVCWCAKEAIYKWNGRRGLEFKQDIHIKPFRLKNEGKLNALVDLPEGSAELTVHYLKMGDGYMLGYVVA
ncbi:MULTISPECIES: 4'-phosphopantetheinyl transferase family protein [Pedobacter]|uniref:4'-phosphopantetheinyl transferase n=1 Tax=Pedobacter heparinus (strain ATCC 13125 / DSM 2366 / CIP 104194 / JCM 7457 / NBRC 12017 / NCIMB 9290 / NRRL B-14731 / HIM 762-3) TaxID=485917 RepID=C6XYI7_PEDHD|nr:MULTISPECIES: 4'-phosphopantetheinyl transferase family protein [Pedobacter]ACU02454.1 4'-phosphopantetheinyl transferase [Pedobacter heparinus DSM 2366]MBB5440140.1 phosphopantetheinyl transferase [Pedobacter sp. AK017]